MIILSTILHMLFFVWCALHRYNDIYNIIYFTVLGGMAGMVDGYWLSEWIFQIKKGR